MPSVSTAPADDDGTDLRSRSVQAINRLGLGGEEVGAASALVGEPFYGRQLNEARDAGADAILVLLSDTDQIVFVAQQESVGVVIPAVLFPHPNTQTRDYIAAVRQYAPVTNPHYRFALWDATLESDGAEAFNMGYIARWGDPADPPAWAAYHAIKIIYESISATGGTTGEDLVGFLENGGTEFDLLKGPGTSFRPWDHQLRQPLYLVRVDQEAVWDRLVPATRVAVAEYAATLPMEDAGNPIDRLDLIGDGPHPRTCTL